MHAYVWVLSVPKILLAEVHCPKIKLIIKSSSSIILEVRNSRQFMVLSGLVHFILIGLCYMFLGLTVLAENINRMRYMSHFRSVHRGAFFQEMRTSEPRQLLPEAWGENYC
jgi:DNA-directed RNA polymerase beta subunit